MAISALLAEQRSMDPSAANIDLGKQGPVFLQLHHRLLRRHFHLLCISFPRGKLSFLHCRPNVYLLRLNAFFDKCIKQCLSYGSLTAQICLDVIRQYHLGNKVEEIGAFISKRVGEGLNSLNQLMLLSSRESTAGIWL